MNTKFSDIVSESNKMVYLDLITRQLSSQQHIDWRFGACDALILPVHKSIILATEKIKTNLKKQIKKSTTEPKN